MRSMLVVAVTLLLFLAAAQGQPMGAEVPPAVIPVDPAVRERLLQLALGMTSGGDVRAENAAADELVKLDPMAGLKLLPAANIRVRVIGTNALWALPATPELMAESKLLLRSQNTQISVLGAKLLAKAPRGPLSADAIKVIGEALKSVAERQDRTNLIQGGVNDLTVEETLYLGYETALRNSLSGNKAIRDLLDDLKNPARSAVIIALGGRKVMSVHDEILAIMRDPEAGALRTAAAATMMQIGTPEDLPFLKQLAQQDPLVRKGLVDVSGSSERGDVYPVRRIAANMVYWIEQKHRLLPAKFPPPTAEQEQAWEQTNSTDRNQINRALNLIDGRPLNQAQFDQVAQFLKHSDLQLRNHAATVLSHGAHDPALAARAVEVIGDALAEVPEVPNLNESVGGYLGQVKSTVGERLYQGYLSALSGSHATDAELLKIRERLHGVSRDIVTIALASRMNTAVHDDLVQFINRSDTGMIRSWAVRRLLEIPQAGDIALLQEIANTDPVVANETLEGGRRLRPGSRYPVREEAAGAVLELERRFVE